MDTVKIGKFLAELRHEKELTQEQLAERLGTSNRTISRWENGNYMPPVEMLAELSEFYGVSINEIISGKRLEISEEKKVADDNLKEILSDSPFTLEERKKYFSNKWKQDHSLSLIVEMIVIITALILGIRMGWELLVILTIAWGVLFPIGSYNQMMAYVERNAFDGKNPDDNKKS